MNLTQLALLKSRVQLNLIEDRHDAGFARDALEVLGLEVGDADRPNAALLFQADEGPPRIDVKSAARRRPMDEIEIDIVETQPAQAPVKGLQRRVEPLRLVP